MPRRSNTQTPNSDVSRWPRGQVLLWIAVSVFVASMVAGLARSFGNGHWLPSVGVEYTTELNAIVQERGAAAALPEIRSAAKIDFDNEMAVTRLLLSAREAGNKDEIVWALTALARLKPEDGQVRNELTSALLDQGRIVEAYAQGRFAVWLTPDLPESYCNLGAALLQLGKKQQAAIAYRLALEIDPNSQTARRVLESSLRGF